MRRMLLAGMLALPFLLATASQALAQGAGCNTPGGCGGGVIPPRFDHGGGGGYGGGSGGYHGPFHGLGLGCPPAGPFSVGFRLFSRIHQEGPLVNYGPYEGYYPFEPYGPWTSDLKYTGPIGRQGGNAATGRLRLNELSSGCSGGLGCGGRLGHHGVHQSPCGTCSSGHTWGSYSLATLKNVGHRINPWQHRHTSGCSTCHSAIQPSDSIQTVGLSMTER
jgi:hypothetical protein